MDAGLVTSLSGALATSKQVELIANNLANADTPGFKSDDLTFEESLTDAIAQDTRSDIPQRTPKDSELFSRAGDEVRPVLYGSQFVDFREGSMKQTGNPLDLAIKGNGFLEVATPSGVRLTRAGNLSVDSTGRLTTRDGFLVLGPGQNTANPETRAINVGSSNIIVDREGNIYRQEKGGNLLVGTLSLVSVENPKGLKKEGNNLFEATADALAKRKPASAETPKTNPLGSTLNPPEVIQGMVEGSNVNPIAEMTKLIDAHRSFDQNTKIMQTMGNISQTVNEIGKF